MLYTVVSKPYSHFVLGWQQEGSNLPPPLSLGLTYGCSYSNMVFGTIAGAVIDALGSFVAAVLAHPAVQDAVADAIVLGMTKVARDPQLDENLMIAEKALSKSNEERAKQAGKDAPKLLGKIWEGMQSAREEEKAKLQTSKEE